MRLGIFTDSHYSSAEVTCGNRYNNKSLTKIEEALRHFEEENCDLVIFLGDLTDFEKDPELERANLRSIAALFRKSRLPVSVVMGNHDAFTFTPDEFYGIIGEECRPKNIIQDGKTLLFPDTCYFSDGRHYMPGDSDWTDTFLPDADRLEDEIRAAEGDVYVFIHQNLDPDVHAAHILSNGEQVRGIFEKCGNVRTVYQGHYHPGHENVVKGIRYKTFPAMCENDLVRFTEII